ncbi:L-aminoadipate-semialdehyde dehydrogenase-phosphopantetheinyl transferase [Aspergillus udagawae]|uniref:holo-[acyl-carrier-protein] synthase n=1 Tax=Aspergillus udagawae TaxID=91492 RepID=A0ABQ1A338_9EURO|nr:L-aminoadipate-semialdehyde dehydrogenase-phosphopantetheinyl transferase [Aspergillus udagawae]GFF72427.1 L-aminoadipate-semialdehyde dehydrogenase-phosphopantetheinyl transferase [Aspergillus udagawae]GFG00632.1 L-aminoadipate-semialdehyde dehydrogenase-phosphopantetheinyl transferase [Aspergillus udagawae]GFG19806.1 L-aminoadipate-semialdehyde dehydrogenase-phosphopantetheinyl transferase [Aspergillus udagawae]
MGSVPNEREPSLTRWYIDTRQLTATNQPLPLLETLQPSDQETVKKFYHLKDRHMSLASNLLKYLFIHRSCRIPWNKISISRTPAPHRRPCFIPSPALTEGTDEPIPSIEFNVSHQASLVALAGTISPPSNVASTTPAAVFANPSPSSVPASSVPQVGIDITCVDERRARTSSAPSTRKQLAEYVDIFAEVFSQRELETIKNLGGRFPAEAQDGAQETEAVEYGLRLFYTYWALKEAYIKMTGEALLAPWLRELEFTDVVAPAQVQGLAGDWGEPYTGIKTWLYGKRVEDVRIEVVAFENDYIFATAARGAGLGAGSRPLPASAGVTVSVDPWMHMERIDIDKDIAPCATGACQCVKK